MDISRYPHLNGNWCKVCHWRYSDNLDPSDLSDIPNVPDIPPQVSIFLPGRGVWQYFRQFDFKRNARRLGRKGVKRTYA